MLKAYHNAMTAKELSSIIGYYRLLLTRLRLAKDCKGGPVRDYLISSLLCNCDGGARFGVVSGTPVPAESRMKSGFFAPKALQDGLFWKWVQIGIFPDFGEKCGKIGEKKRETAIHRKIELQTDENLL